MTSVVARARAAAVTPGLVAFLASSRVRRHRQTAFSALRSLDPVHLSPLGLAVVSRHAEVGSILRNPSFGSDEAKADPALLRLGPLRRLRRSAGSAGPNEFRDTFELLMLFADPPDHTRLRSLVSSGFTRRRVEDLKPRVHEIAEDLLRPLRRAGRAEIVHDFAYPFPARVICELLGLPEPAVELFIRHGPGLAVALDPGPMRTAASVRAANTAVRTLSAYLLTQISERRRTPTDDLLTALVEADADGERLSEAELVAMVLLLVIAGHETTANVLGSATVRMIRDSALRHGLAAAQDGELSGYVEEFLRLDGPIQMSQRIALKEMRLDHRDIPVGMIVILLIAAANRDPSVFPEPNRFRASRERNPHLTFGAGAHFCLGAPLARLELAAALPLVARLPESLRLEGRAEQRQSFTIGGYDRVPCVW